MSGMKPTKPWRFSGGGRAIEGDGCDIRFRIDLMGVRAPVAAIVRTGDTLDVAIVRDGELRAVVCQTERGERVGSISAFPGLARLIDCMEAGVRYSASVERSSERSCSVLVMRAAQ